MRDRIRTEVAKLPDASRHLRNLETAPIATIHGFCGNLLRQFAVPAHLDPGFEVLDDVLSANIRADALGACLHGLLGGEPSPGGPSAGGPSPGGPSAGGPLAGPSAGDPAGGPQPVGAD